MPGKVAVLSHIVIDEIYDPAGRHTHDDVGGAGAYAAVGASLVSPAGTSLLVSGTGRSDLVELTKWCRDRSIDARGLFVVGDHGPRTRIEYFTDGERVESPVYGLAHFDGHTPLPLHLPAALDGSDLAALYLFHSAEEEYWKHIERFRQSSPVPILWELSAEATTKTLEDTVRQRSALVDVVSLNRTEAFSLFGTSSFDEATRSASELAPIVLLRIGGDGSLLLENDRQTRIPAAPTTAADPTGGGNSYSGAFIAAYRESGNAEWAARYAAAAAATVIATPGAPLVDDALRAHVRSIAESLTASITE